MSHYTNQPARADALRPPAVRPLLVDCNRGRDCRQGEVMVDPRQVESLCVVSVAERVLLRDKGKPGRQDFLNDVPVQIIAKFFVFQLY